jgi:hypothetical protein
MAGIFVNSSMLEGINLVIGKFAEWIAIPVSETLEAERISLNKLYLQILDTNTGTDDRIKLIRELQSTYPGFLSNIDAEKVSNQDLAKAVKAVNDQLINKIIIQEKDEEIAKLNITNARVREKLMKDEDKLREEIYKISQKYNLSLKEGLTLEEMALDILQRSKPLDEQRIGRHGELQGKTAELVKTLNEYRTSRLAVNNIDEKTNVLIDKRNQLMERLGLNMEESIEPDRNPIADRSEEPEIPGVPIDDKKTQEKLDQLQKQYEAYLQKIQGLRRQYELSGMEDQDREIAIVQDKYQELEAQLGVHLANKTIQEAEFVEQAKELADLRAQEISAINLKYTEKEVEERRKAETTIRDATLEEKELARIRIEEHYDRLREMAQQYGMDTLSIEEARLRDLRKLEQQNAQAQIEDQRRIAEAKVMIAQAMGDSIGAVINLVGAKSGELTGFQKLLVGAQIAMDTAAALGRIVPLAADAAKGTGPAAPFVFAGYLASMGATVLTAIAKAKSALSDAQAPEWNSTEKEQKSPRQTRTPVSSYYYGGDTGAGNMGFGDQYGKFAGFVHQDEFVVPSFIRSHPYVANVLPVIEDIRQEKIRGFYRGGETTRPQPTAAPSKDSNLGGLMQELIRLQKSQLEILSKMPTKLKAYLIYSELEEIREEMDDLERKYKR